MVDKGGPLGCNAKRRGRNLDKGGMGLAKGADGVCMLMGGTDLWRSIWREE